VQKTLNYISQVSGIMTPTRKASSYNPDTDIPDLTGKVALVSGGNGGIGYHTVKELAKHGAKVYMGSRSEAKAKTALVQLKDEGALDGPGSVEWLKLDISTPALARAGAEEFMRRESRLDILVNNAGLLASSEVFVPTDTKVPVALIMSTNHIGPFVLTNTLLSLIKKTAAEPGSDVRVINVASDGHRNTLVNDWKRADWNWKSNGLMPDIKAYGTSKLANILFAKELQRRFDNDGVNAMSISLHPGVIATEGGLNSTNAVPFVSGIVRMIFKFVGLTPAQGAYTSLFAATSSYVAANRSEYAGAYLDPFGVIAKPNPEAENLQNAKDCWVTTEDLVARM